MGIAAKKNKSVENEGRHLTLALSPTEAERVSAGAFALIRVHRCLSVVKIFAVYAFFAVNRPACRGERAEASWRK
jgi:hypothetical protein